MRKNLKSHEWKPVLAKLDRAPWGTQTRVCISGRVVPKHRIDRARRHCNKIAGRALSSLDNTALNEILNDGQICIQMQKPDGTWVAYPRLTGHTSLPLPSTEPFFDEGDNVSFGLEGDEAFGFSSPLLDSQIGPMMSLDQTDASSTWQLSLPDAFNYVRSNGGHASPIMLRPPTEWEWLARLPFQRFENTWKTVNQREFDVFEKGLALSNKLGIWYFIEQVSNTDPRRWIGEPLSRPALLRLIRTGIAYLPEHGTSARIDRIPDNDHASITEEEMTNTTLFRLIISSMINGLASLGNVPIENMVQFLDRFQRMNLLVSRFLQFSERHTAKAFVESLLSAAIRQNRESVVVEILATKLLDDVTKLHFLNESVDAENLEVSIILLDTILDSAKSKNGNLIYSDNLRQLLSFVVRQDSDWTPYVQRVLNAGVTLTAEDLKDLFSDGEVGILCRTELCYSIASSMNHFQHEKYVSAHWFFFVATALDEAAAVELTSEFISFCHKMHGSKCIRQSQEYFDWGVITAAKRGFCDLVRLQLPLCCSHSRVLVAAIWSGNTNLIKLVMDQQPDINQSHCIEHRNICRYSSKYLRSIARDRCKPNSALAEAIRNNNARLIQILEFGGVLDHLSGKRFDAAITAAAEIEDVSYFKKLIDHRSIGRNERTRALLLSIYHGWDAITIELLDTSARIDENILHAAVQQRNGLIIQKTLNAGITGEGSTQTLCEAIEWGDRSLITQLLSIFVFPKRFWTANPSEIYSESFDMILYLRRYLRHKLTIEELSSHLPPPLVFAKYIKGNDMFDFLLGTKLATRQALNGCLICAVLKNDSDFLRLLIDQGADPLDSHVLEFAVHDRPSMLHLLLSQANQEKRKVTRGLRTSVLTEAIRMGRDIAFIKALIESGLIDIFDTDRFSDLNPLGEAISLSNKNSSLSLEITLLLLKAGHNPNSIVELRCWGGGYIPNVNQTALLKSIEMMNLDIVQALMDRGANVNEPAVLAIKRTPLQKASEIGSLELVQLLISRGADANGEAAFQGGGTALQMAAISGNCNVAAKLLSAGALLHMPPSKIGGRWPLEGAAEHGRLDMIELLWKANQEIVFCGGKTGFEEEHCIRAMTLAKKEGHFGCKDLIEKLSGFKLPQAQLDIMSDSEKSDFYGDEESFGSEFGDEISSIASED